MNQNELMHYGVPGQKWGVRRWQEKLSGSLTPEGRIHYGVGPARSKVTGTAENTHKKPDKQEKETGYEKLKKSAQAITKQAKEGFNAAKKEASERASKLYEDAKKRAQEAAERREEKRRLEEERKEQEEKEEKERRAMGDRSDKWKEYEDNELQAFTTRKRLEDAANDAQFSAKIQKADRLRQVVAEANNYLSTGLQIYDNYKKLKVAFSPEAQPAQEKTKSSELAKEVLDLIKDMPAKEFDNAFVNNARQNIKTVQDLEDAAKNKKIQSGKSK